MIDWFITILRTYPPLALFLTIGLGFLVGRIKFGNFQLGSVTAVLLIAILVGQLNIPMSGPIKMFFLYDVSLLDRLFGGAGFFQIA